MLKRLREWSDVPVLVLSVREQEKVKVEALESGADDYVTKPFGTAELLARLAVIQRRCFTRHSAEITAGGLVLNLLHHEASLNGQPLKLTPTEFALLKALAEHSGRIVTQGQIFRQVWAGQAGDPSEGRIAPHRSNRVNDILASAARDYRPTRITCAVEGDI